MDTIFFTVEDSKKYLDENEVHQLAALVDKLYLKKLDETGAQDELKNLVCDFLPEVQRRLEKALNEGRQPALIQRTLVSEGNDQVSQQVIALENELKKLKQEKDAWQSEANMYANAWQRELGSMYRKTHLIDALVLTTRAMKKQLDAFREVAKTDYR